MSGHADLHIHTSYSDSTSSPEEVIEDAQKQNLKCIAITDHDITDGVLPAQQAAKAYGIEVLPGIELSSQQQGTDIHILGYLFDMENARMKEHLQSSQQSRVERMRSMIERLKDLGHGGIALEEVCALTSADAVGRPHLAKIMLDRGIVSSMREAFDKYLADDKPVCVPKFLITTLDAIQLIREAGGVAVLAHPYVTKVDELIPQLAAAGLQGIEVFYPNTTHNEREYYLNLAKKNNLLVTGGSDAHGDAKTHTWVGNIQIDYTYVEKLKECAHV